MKTTLTTLFIAGAASALAAFGPNQRTSANPSAAGTCPFGNAGGTGSCVVADATTPLVLGAEAQKALLFQMEEERMARELYAAFGAKHGLTVFANIQKSEAQHEAAFAALAKRAGLAVPAGTSGVFASSEVQARYDALLKLGLESPEAALRTGAFVEEQDIIDLRDLAKSTDDAAIRLAAVNQERASGNHLSAFVRNLQARGGAYQAQALSAEEVAAILKNAPGGGRGGNGNGRGGNGGGWRGGASG